MPGSKFKHELKGEMDAMSVMLDTMAFSNFPKMKYTHEVLIEARKHEQVC